VAISFNPFSFSSASATIISVGRFGVSAPSVVTGREFLISAPPSRAISHLTSFTPLCHFISFPVFCLLFFFVVLFLLLCVFYGILDAILPDVIVSPFIDCYRFSRCRSLIRHPAIANPQNISRLIPADWYLSRALACISNQASRCVEQKQNHRL